MSEGAAKKKDAPQQRPRSAIGVGLTTLVTIMVVVLLTTFSVLSLVSARSDLSLSQKVMTSIQDYYAADTQAEQWIASLDAALAGRWDSGTAAALAAAGYNVEPKAEGAGCYVSQTFALGSERQLVVKLDVSGEGKVTVLTWQSGPKNDGNENRSQ